MPVVEVKIGDMTRKFTGLHPGRFAGSVAFITGGTSGLGEHTAYHLAQEGAAVVITGRREDRGAAVVKNIEAVSTSTLTPKALFCKADVQKHDEVEGAYKKTKETYGRLDAVFANAGVGDMTALSAEEPTPYPLVTDPLGAWHKVVDINLNGVYYTIRYGVPLMKQTGDVKKAPTGAFVLCSSIYGLSCALAANSAYCTTKHALEGLKKACCQDFASDGTTIRCNNVNPSFTPSELVDPFYGMKSGAKMIETWQPGNHLAEQGNVASVVAWLLSEDSSYVNGLSVPVDGGMMTSWCPASVNDELMGNMMTEIGELTKAAQEAAAKEAETKKAELPGQVPEAGAGQ